MAGLLENYDRMQSMPFGQYSAMTSGPAVSGLKSQRRMMSSALRKGISRARRGGMPEQMANYINMSNAAGLQTTGIRNYDQRMEGDFQAAQAMATQAETNTSLANRAMRGVYGQPGSGPDGSGGGAAFASRALGTGVGDQEDAKRMDAALKGHFGKDAQEAARRKQANSLVDLALKDAPYEIGGTLDEVTAMQKVDPATVDRLTPYAEAIGGDANSFWAAINRRRGAVKAAQPTL